MLFFLPIWDPAAPVGGILDGEDPHPPSGNTWSARITALELTNTSQMVSEIHSELPDLNNFSTSHSIPSDPWPPVWWYFVCTHSLSQSFSAMHLFLFTADLSMYTVSYSVVSLILSGAHSLSQWVGLATEYVNSDNNFVLVQLTLWCFSYSVLLVVWFHSQSITLQSLSFVLSQQGQRQGSEVISVVFG